MQLRTEKHSSKKKQTDNSLQKKSASTALALSAVPAFQQMDKPEVLYREESLNKEHESIISGTSPMPSRFNKKNDVTTPIKSSMHQPFSIQQKEYKTSRPGLIKTMPGTVTQLVAVTVDDKQVDVTKDMDVEHIIDIVKYKQGKGFNRGSFAGTISSEDAKKLIAELKKHPQAKGELEDLIADLDDLVDAGDEEEDAASDDRQDDPQAGLNEDELIEEIDYERMEPAEKKARDLRKDYHFSQGDAEKIVTGLEVQQLFADWGGKQIYLSGGGAIALMIRHRTIEDLDFRIHSDAFGGKSSWYKFEKSGNESEWVPDTHLDELNKIKKGQAFSNVPKGKTPNATNTRTAGVVNFNGSGIEVSITIVGQQREVEKDEKTGINRLSKGELLSDKLKTAISRSKMGDKYIGKVSKDIYDALAVYLAKYDTDTVDEGVLKEHLGGRAEEYRQSNTDEDRRLLQDLGVEQLVQRMFNRLIITVNILMEEQGKLEEFVEDKDQLKNALDSLSTQQLKPVWDGWFKVVKQTRRLKKVPVIEPEDIESLEAYKEEMAGLIHFRINEYME